MYLLLGSTSVLIVLMWTCLPLFHVAAIFLAQSLDKVYLIRKLYILAIWILTLLVLGGWCYYGK